MPIKLPTHKWLFQCDIKPLLERGGRDDFGRHPDKRDEMIKICNEYDQLEFYEDTVQVNKPLIGEHVIIPGYEEIIAIPKDKEKLINLLLRTHSVIKNIWVPSDIYRRMGETFDTYGYCVEDDELEMAIKLASEVGRQDHDERNRRFNASIEVQKTQARGKERL